MYEPMGAILIPNTTLALYTVRSFAQIANINNLGEVRFFDLVVSEGLAHRL